MEKGARSQTTERQARIISFNYSEMSRWITWCPRRRRALLLSRLSFNKLYQSRASLYQRWLPRTTGSLSKGDYVMFRLIC